MGLEIVRQECGGDLGRCSRLIGTEEVCDLLKNNKGTDAVEAIVLDLSQVEELHLSADTFNKMTNLRYLGLQNSSGRTSGAVNLPIILKPFSDKLRLLVWDGYPLKSLPPNFCAKFLVTIFMPNSNVKELWHGTQDLVNLVYIELMDCKQLIKLPDLSKASKLKKVNLSNCESLCELHPSVLSLDSLTSLILDGCIKLKSLKSERHLKSLQKPSVVGCSNLKEFAVSSDLIEILDLRKTGVKTLHSSIGRLINLKLLNLEGLSLKNLPDELCCLTTLMELKISNCIAVNKQKLCVLFDSLRSLKVLYLKDCCNLSELPDNINLLSMLRELRLDGSSVEMLPTTIKQLQELETVSLEYCSKLKCLPELPRSIRKLYADNCTSLVTIPQPCLRKRIDGFQCSFKNCVKLDGRSFNGIVEDAMIVSFFRFNYTRTFVCMSGSRVPRQFTYRTTQSFINIEIPPLPNLLGFISSVVLSSPSPKKNTECKIICKCYLPNGTNVKTWCAFTADFNSSHVFVWYDRIDDFSISGGTVSFEFSVTGSHDGLIVMKECGVRLIYVSEFYSFLRELEWTLDNKVELGMQFELWLDLHYLDLRVRICEEYPFFVGPLKMMWDESGYRAISMAIEKGCEKSNGIVPEPLSVLGELEMEFDKKVELGLKLGLALDLKQLESEMKEWQSYGSKFRAFLKAIVNVAQKSNEFVLESHCFSGDSELEFDEKVMLGVCLGLHLEKLLSSLKIKRLKRLFNHVLTDGSELEESLKLEFESRRRTILTKIEEETQKSNEFVFPYVPTRIWKNRTQGLKDIVSLFP